MRTIAGYYIEFVSNGLIRFAFFSYQLEYKQALSNVLAHTPFDTEVRDSLRHGECVVSMGKPASVLALVPRKEGA
jgi:hypothetical protein